MCMRGEGVSVCVCVHACVRVSVERLIFLIFWQCLVYQASSFFHFDDS